jgi:hypothetical protein
MGDHAAAAGPFPSALRRSIGVIMIGSALSFLDSTIINVALRSLSVSLHAPLAQVQWVVTGYLLALAAVIPVTGWAARRAGPSRLYIGPTLGGLLVQGLGWQAIFWLNVPLGVTGIILGIRLLPRTSGTDAGPPDLAGLVLAAGGTTSLTYGLAQIGSQDGPKAGAVAALAAGTVLLAAFVLRSGRIARPLLDVRLYASRAFAAASVTSFSLGAAMFGGMILMPLYFQVVRGQDVIATGLLLAPSGAGALLANRLAAPMTDRLGAGATALAGGLVSLAATVPFAFLGARTSYLLLCLAMVIRGAGIGLSLMPAMTAAYRALPAGTTFTWVLAITAIATAPALLLARAERHARTMPPATSPTAMEDPDEVH